MAIGKLILRSSAVAASAGAAVAAVLHMGVVGQAAGADAAPVILAPVILAPDAQPGASLGNAPDENPQDIAATPPEPAVARSALGLPCGLTLTAEAMPGAMVALDVMDPCAAGAQVEIRHGALRIDAELDAMGLLTLDVPALETPAFFTASLDTGAEATTLTGLPDLIDYHRAAILWSGPLDLELHGYQGDADFGGPGHIRPESPGSVVDATIGSGGFLTVLGGSSQGGGWTAQVFTTPRVLSDDLSLVVEVPITDATCGQPVRAQALQSAQGGPVTVQPVALTMPGCDTVGEFLMLQNLFGTPRLGTN